MEVIKIIAVYIAVMNILGFATMGLDKWKAIHHAWRIPEFMLFLVALLGGSIGSFIGMHLFRHKTKHWYFLYGIPTIMALQIIAAAYLIGSDKITIM